MTATLRGRAIAHPLLGAAAMALCISTAFGSRLGVPPGPAGGDPAGYLMLVSSDTVKVSGSNAKLGGNARI